MLQNIMGAESMKSSSANLGFEQKLWQVADKLRNNMDAAEYKHVVLGLIFLKYISDAFIEIYNEQKNDPERLSDPEDIDCFEEAYLSKLMSIEKV